MLFLKKLQNFKFYNVSANHKHLERIFYLITIHIITIKAVKVLLYDQILWSYDTLKHIFFVIGNRVRKLRV